MKKRAMIPLLAVAACLCCAPARSEYPPERPARTSPSPVEGNYSIHPDRLKQVIKGLGFEIQLDSIASGNQGLPNLKSGVPHDLLPSERQRFYREMLGGFRYCRLAAGLYWRGLDADSKQVGPRWPSQIEELREMIQQAGIEGVSFEYWSPAPYWKANNQLVGGGPLRCFDPSFASDATYHGDVDKFLGDFGDACVRDLKTLRDAGIPISMWGLQNEPFAKAAYSSCSYSPENYSKTFLSVAPNIRALDPKIWIIADTASLKHIAPALRQPQANGLIDAFVVHHVGSDSAVVTKPLTPKGFTQPSFQNEFEYLHGPTTPARCLNTVQHIMNWFQRGNAPTWFWIHGLKPVGNQEASGYALGYWAPPQLASAGVSPELANLQPGHWTWNKYNWHAVAGFLRHMPWNSQAVQVAEEQVNEDARIFAFKRPDGKLVVVLSNRTAADYRFKIDTGLQNATFEGWRYSPEEAGANFEGKQIGSLRGGTIAPRLPDLCWDFWVQK